MKLDSEKGKLNKLKVGQKVRAKRNLVDWFSSHLCWSYGRNPTDGGYSENQKEIAVEDLHKVYAWSGARLSQKMPVGVVSHYGSADYDEKKKKYLQRKYVWVSFTFKTEIGNLVDGTYVSEKDLESVRKK